VVKLIVLHRRDAGSGDPPGLITMAMVDRPKIWAASSALFRRPLVISGASGRAHITVDFTVFKHRLADVKARSRPKSTHVGDTDMDHFC